MRQQQSDTPQELSCRVLAALADLEELEKVMLARGLDMLKANDGATYAFDFLAVAALNRSLALASGFCALLRAQNLICGGALVRLQLDTALRFFAGFIVDKPAEFAIAVLDGKHIRRMKDRGGNLMTDRYLLTEMSKEFPWVGSVYERSSGYVHLSDAHVTSAFDGVDRENRSVSIKIGSRDRKLPDAVYLDVIAAFRASSGIVLRYVDGWIATKSSAPRAADAEGAGGEP